jgi:hypothetical protein
MEPIPFEFPESAYAWAEVTQATLQSRLDLADSESSPGLAPANWQEPDDPNWSILVAHWLCDSEDIFPELGEVRTKKNACLEQFLTQLIRWFRQSISQQSLDLTVLHLQRLVLVQHVAILYTKVYGLGLSRIEGSLIQVLFASGHPTAIILGVDLLLSQSPSNWAEVSLALSPLVQSKTWDIENVFPRLLQSTDPSVLSPALDVANHAMRSRNLASILPRTNSLHF